MKKLLICCIFPLYASAQNGTTWLDKDKKLSVGLGAAPELTFPKIASSVYRSQTITSTPGFVFGVYGQQQCSGRLALRASAGYRSEMVTLKLEHLNVEDYDPATGQFPESTLESDLIFKELYVEMSGLYTLADGVFYCSAGAGLSYVFQNSLNTYLTTSKGLVTRNSDRFPRMMNLAPSIGIGFNFRRHKRKLLSLEPYAKWSIFNYGSVDYAQINLPTVGIKGIIWF